MARTEHIARICANRPEFREPLESLIPPLTLIELEMLETLDHATRFARIARMLADYRIRQFAA